MTLIFHYELTVTSEEEITPNVTGDIIEQILGKTFKKGKCEIKLLRFEGK